MVTPARRRYKCSSKRETPYNEEHKSGSASALCEATQLSTAACFHGSSAVAPLSEPFCSKLRAARNDFVLFTGALPSSLLRMCKTPRSSFGWGVCSTLTGLALILVAILVPPALRTAVSSASWPSFVLVALSR